MAVVKQGERRRDPFSVQSEPKRPPVCARCRERREGLIYMKDPNGSFICMDCASPSDRRAFGECDPDTCACGKTNAEDPDPA